jgi:ribosomal protein L37E
MKAKKEQIQYLRRVINNQLHMECKVCGQFTTVGEDTTATTCHECVRESYEKDFPFQPSVGYKPTGRPRGWAFMKEYVDKDGNVYHKGKEQPKLKGTLKPTVIKPKPVKPKLTKAQKQRIKTDAYAKIHKLKKQLNKAKFKKDQKRINSEIKKLQKIAK